MKIKNTKEFVNASIHRAFLLFQRSRIKVQNVTLDNYQIKRDSARRFDSFSALVSWPLSTLDIGCNQGYFVFRSALFGGFCIGVDPDHHSIEVAQATAHTKKIQNVAFFCVEVNPINVNFLPHTDLTLCLSVFHHWVKHFGSDKAIAMLERLAQNTKRYFIFETGQPDETADWATSMDFIPSINEWTKELFSLKGFMVKSVGKFKTLNLDERTLYFCTKTLKGEGE